MRIFRFAKRSAIIPAHGPRNSDGRNCSATVMPTAVTEPESWSTSQSWAIRCIQSAIDGDEVADREDAEIADLERDERVAPGRAPLTTAMGWVLVSGREARSPLTAEGVPRKVLKRAGGRIAKR